MHQRQGRGGVKGEESEASKGVEEAVMAGLLASGPVGKEGRIGRRDLADANADE